MSICHYHIHGIDIYVGNYDDIAPDSLSVSQNGDVTACLPDKKQRERSLVYTLINYAASHGPAIYSSIAGVPLSHYDNGAPYLDCSPTHRLLVYISVSHCRSGACIALSRLALPFGIDIEDESDKLARVKSKFIADSETVFIGDDLLLPAWTIKEAVYKAAGIAGLPLRNGIVIQSITDTNDIDLGFTLQADVVVFPFPSSCDCHSHRYYCRYLCHILKEPTRCISLSRLNVK